MHYKRQQTRYPTREAMNKLSADLMLPYRGQDWELVNANSHSVTEFLDYYESQKLNDDEMFALMSLIIASFDELLRAESNDILQDRIIKHLLAKFDVFNYLAQYWALPDEEDPENVFRFTPIARQVMQAMYGDRENWPRSRFVVCRTLGTLSDQGAYENGEISNNRDGTFELYWHKQHDGHGYGSREFSSVAEAMKFAESELGFTFDQWHQIT